MELVLQSCGLEGGWLVVEDIDDVGGAVGQLDVAATDVVEHFAVTAVDERVVLVFPLWMVLLLRFPFRKDYFQGQTTVGLIRLTCRC